MTHSPSIRIVREFYRAKRYESQRDNATIPTDPHRYAHRLAALAAVVSRIDADMGWRPRSVTGTPGRFPTVTESGNTASR